MDDYDNLTEEEIAEKQAENGIFGEIWLDEDTVDVPVIQTGSIIQAETILVESIGSASIVVADELYVGEVSSGAQVYANTVHTQPQTHSGGEIHTSFTTFKAAARRKQAKETYRTDEKRRAISNLTKPE